MSNFYVGQKVVSLKTGPWWYGGNEFHGPIRNEVLVITSIECGRWVSSMLFLGFKEYAPHTYYSGEFRPLEECDQSEDLTRELATQFLERIVHEELDIIPNKQHAAQ